MSPLWQPGACKMSDVCSIVADVSTPGRPVKIPGMAGAGHQQERRLFFLLAAVGFTLAVLGGLLGTLRIIQRRHRESRKVWNCPTCLPLTSKQWHGKRVQGQVLQ